MRTNISRLSSASVLTGGTSSVGVVSVGAVSSGAVSVGAASLLRALELRQELPLLLVLLAIVFEFF